MKPDAAEERLERHFAAMRRRDAGRAPDFRRLTQPRAGRAALAGGRWLRLAAAAAAVAALAGAALVLRGGRRPCDAFCAWSAISEWQASTDALLTVSSAPWGSEASPVTDAWIQEWSEMSETSQARNGEVL